MKWEDVRVGDVINFSDDRGDGWNYTCLVLYQTTSNKKKSFQVVRISTNNRPSSRRHAINKDYFDQLNIKLLARADVST